MPVLEKVEVKWVSIQKPNIQFAPAWEVQVTLSPDQAKKILAEAKAIHPKGIKLKKEDDNTISLRLKRLVARKDDPDKQNNPPVCVGLDGKTPFTKLIGNGSICNVQYALIPWNNKFGSGVTTDFKGIQVLQHVAYGVQDGEEFTSASDDASLDKDDDTPFKSNDFDDGDFE